MLICTEASCLESDMPIEVDFRELTVEEQEEILAVALKMLAYKLEELEELDWEHIT